MTLKDLLHPIKYYRKRKAEIQKQAEEQAKEIEVIDFDKSLKDKIKPILPGVINVSPMISFLKESGYTFCGNIKAYDPDDLFVEAAKRGADTILEPQMGKQYSVFSSDKAAIIYWTQAYRSK